MILDVRAGRLLEELLRILVEAEETVSNMIKEYRVCMPLTVEEVSSRDKMNFLSVWVVHETGDRSGSMIRFEV